MTGGSLSSIPIPQQREAVALYISSLAAEIRQPQRAATSDATSLPDFVTGVRRKYLNAVQAQVSAKRAFTEKGNSLAAQGAAVVPDCGDAIILNRLNSSRQRQQQASLSTLSRHVTAFERLLPSSHPNTNQHESSNAVSAAPESMERLRGQSEDLLGKLEMAVFNARMRAERGKLTAPAAHSATRPISGGSAVSRLRALRAVHEELTAWVEESLAACAQHEPPSVPVVGQEDGRPDHKNSELEAAYGRYVQGRKSMTAAVDMLSQPLPSIVHERGTEKPVPVVAVEADSAVTVQKRVRAWQELQRSKLTAEYARAEIEKESEEAAAVIDRLADESQLLHAYPRLAKLPGSRQIAPGAVRGVPSDRVKTQTEAWSFASGAADESLSVAIDHDLADGNRAIDEALKTLRDLALLRESVLTRGDS
ncbi:hypothetical protein DV737_g4125, partial [Chaetothyriales sp. CBS 132003]